jgi:hypothetical protein
MEEQDSTTTIENLVYVSRPRDERSPISHLHKAGAKR